ncbi:WD repeat-containing protein 48 [Metopolophium dirhodum]|uniref:WD repeat-containing protein 48 n=1 Tax=Metopolophium dirhodum TaxID=44670 RepID=UPI00298F907B|nr:WD repeat-containing protein 48 [Metopolophium dirhodum]
MSTLHKNCLAQPGRKKVQISFVIRDEEERRHRAGINSLQLDSKQGILYSAGRDGIIRQWDVRDNVEATYLRSLEHHTDWVNDIVLCCGGNYLISASSDTTVKLWGLRKENTCLSTLRTHKDYVRALAYARDKEVVASAGLDKTIFMWDVNMLTTLTTTNNTVTTASLPGSKNSIYSLAMNNSGTVLISGSTEKVLRVWDTRTSDCMMKLIGHTDNVKALVVNRDGTQCLSGSSDGTIKLWSLGQQQCIQTLRIHKEGVWALAATENFSHVVSGGRDKKIYMTDLKNPNRVQLICNETAPVVKMVTTPDMSAIWVATSESSINCWKLRKSDETADFEDVPTVPYNQEPFRTLKGAAAIRKYHVLNDKRTILTQDTEKNVAVYDVLKASKLQDLGEVDFDDEIKKRHRIIFIPNWFSVDLKTGMLTIHLGQDENDCFAAWVSAKEAGINVTDDNLRVNYGNRMLRSLLENWLNRIQTDHGSSDGAQSTEVNAQTKLDSQCCRIPKHTPLMISEVGGRCLYRMLVSQAGDENDVSILNETIPAWVMNVIVEKSIPKALKISFYLVPLSNTCIRPVKNGTLRPSRDRLVANDFIQVQKIAEYIHEKLSENDGSGPYNKTSDCISNHLQGNTPEKNFELSCNDQILSPTMDLRTLKHFIWKSSADLTIYFKAKH